jgi:hypothetical protein
VTPADVLVEARKLLQDVQAPQRYSDADLLGYVNQTVRRMVLLRPDLFASLVTIPTTPNVVEQLLPADAVRLVEIFRVVGGKAIEEVDRDLFNRAYPDWATDPAGLPTKYVRHARNPRLFFLYPRPSVGVQLVAEYVSTPPTYALTDTISVLPEAYFGPLLDGVMYLASSIDDEHVSNRRAELFLNSFKELLGLSLRSRVVTDTEGGPAPPAQEPNQ